MKITCSNCGSIYELTSQKIPLRDKDSIECDVCGSVIHEWNEAKMWSSQLLEKHEDHLNPDKNVKS